MHTITTPAGRIIEINHETARTLEAVSMSPAQIDTDIDALIAGTLSLAGLSGICEDGCEDDATSAAWSDYMHKCMAIADNEMLARQATA